MKQIIVVTDHRDRFEGKLPAEDFYVVWCGFSVEELLKVRHNSNLILLCMDNEDHNALEKMGLYLRDACIEEEKMLYLYGNKEDVQTVASLVPAMFIKDKVYLFGDFNKFVEKLIKEEVEAEYGRPRCVIVDEDSEYVEQLRLQLEGFYRVYVCGYDVEAISKLVPDATLTLLCVDGSMKLSETMWLFRLLIAKRKTSKFRYFLMKSSNGEKEYDQMGSEESKITFYKDMDVERVGRMLPKPLRA